MFFEKLQKLFFFNYFFLFCFTVICQENTPSSSGDDNTEHKDYWQLTESKVLVSNYDNYTVWTGSPGEIKGEMTRIDNYKIEHTITTKFTWGLPPAMLTPGKESSIYAAFENTDYSSTSPAFSGLIIKLDDYNENISSASEFVKLGRSKKNSTPEFTNGTFFVPFHNEKNNRLLISVNCFIGNDHYITAYIYEWVK